jgi:transposase-like protein
MAKKRGRPQGSTSEVMREKKRRAISLMEINPTLSMAQVARHFEVSEATISKWFKEANFRKWYT